MLLFLECGGETVKGVLKVSEFVSTGAVVLFYQVHKRCNRFSHCLLLTPFRYCSYLLFLHCLSISLPPSDSLKLTCSNFLLFLHNRFPPSDQPNLYPSDKSDDVFLLFFTSCPPTSSLSSVLGVHTVFPTYMPCTMCNTFIVTHAHTLSNTHTDHSAVHITVALVFVWPWKMLTEADSPQLLLSLSHTHTKHWIKHFMGPITSWSQTYAVLGVNDINLLSLKHLVFILHVFLLALRSSTSLFYSALPARLHKATSSSSPLLSINSEILTQSSDARSTSYPRLCRRRPTGKSRSRCVSFISWKRVFSLCRPTEKVPMATNCRDGCLFLLYKTGLNKGRKSIWRMAELLLRKPVEEGIPPAPFSGLKMALTHGCGAKNIEAYTDWRNHTRTHMWQ